MKSEEKIQRLNGNDEYFLDSDTPEAPTHIGGLEIYDLPPGAGRDFLQKYYKQIKSAPVRAEPFNYVLSTLEPEQESKTDGPLGWMQPSAQRKKKEKPVRVWKRLDKVNADEHIYLHALPYPGSQRELGELVARLHVNRLDRSRPLWEYHLIEGLEGGRYAVYVKLHHSQFDGKRGMSLAQYTRSPKRSTRNMPPIWAVDLSKHYAAGAAAAKSAEPAEEPGALQKLTAFGKALSKMGEARQNKPGEGVIGPYTAPPTILNGPLTPRRRLGTVSLPIPRIKALGATVEGGATVNEILLAVIGGALRRYLQDREALPKEPLIAACPVAVARKDGAAAGNAIAQILVSLGTQIADPKKRLISVVESSRANKGLMKELDSAAYTSYVMLSMMPQGLAAKTKYGHKVLNSNLIISNVPGPRETQYVNGARMEAMYAAPLLLPGQALNITASNFGDNLDIGIMACPDLCPSPQRIAIYMGEELATLERAMGIKPARPARKTGLAKRRKAVGAAASKQAAAKKATAKKEAAKKGAAPKATAKKATAKKVAAKKPAAKKATATKPAAKPRRRAPTRKAEAPAASAA